MSRTRAPRSTSSVTVTSPVPGPPTKRLTQERTSTWTLKASISRLAPAPAILPPHGGDHPLEVERRERLRARSPGRPVVPHPGVPDVDHVVPLLLDRLALGRSIRGHRGIALGGALELGPDPAPEVEGAEHGPDASPEAHRLVPGELPAGGGGEGAGEVLEVRARREDAGAERILEVAPAVEGRRLPSDLIAVEGVDAGREPELDRVDRGAGLQRAGRAGAGVQHLVPARAMVVAPGGRVLA